MIPCEYCGTEGRIYSTRSGHPNDPDTIDNDPCPVCKGACEVEIEAQPVTLDDLNCSDCGASLPLRFPCNEQYCPQRERR